MITTDLIGRMGNQMYQYALCRLIAEKNSFNLADKHTSTVDDLKVGGVNEEINRINKLIKKL
jgi:hypothetical protein